MQTSSIPDRRRTRELETGVKLPPSLVTEIIPRMFRILPERCPGGWGSVRTALVSYRTRESGGEAYPGICR